MFFHSFIVKYHLLNLVHLVSDHKLQFITVLRILVQEDLWRKYLTKILQ